MDPQSTPVRVVDFDMPFFSMVLLMCKWALASIPAAIILSVAFGIMGALMVAILTVIGGAL